MGVTGRQRFLGTLHRDPSVEGHPVWLMRQAGRFLPEYRELRSRHSFMELVHSPALCTEAALQPLRRFDLDATIVFSDILVIPDALGMGLSFTPGDGPRLANPLRESGQLEGTLGSLDYVYEAVAQLRAAAPGHALLGFAGAPWTLYCYMVDGEGGEFPLARQSIRADETRAKAMLDRLADVVADHLLAQLGAGADTVQVFDTWAGRLDADTYARLVTPGLERIAARLAEHDTILFLRGADQLSRRVGRAKFSGVSVHAGADLAAVRRELPGWTTQGNVASEILLGGDIEAAVRGVFDATGGAHDHIYNLGHGVVPATPPESVSRFVNAVRALP